jgi:hypothetical protein
MSLRTKKILSWGLISFFTTTTITYFFVGNWIHTIIIAAISVLPEIFDFAILEKKEIIQISSTYGLTSEKMNSK